MSRGTPTGLFAEVLPKTTKAPKMSRMSLPGVDGDSPAAKKRTKKKIVGDTVVMESFDDHDYDD